MSKTCSKCKTEKPYEQFSKNKTKKDGLRSRCKECTNEDEKKYRQKNKEAISERGKKYYEENKDMINKRNKKWREENKEKMNEIGKKYREENKEKIKKYKQENKEAISEWGKKYGKENRKKINEYHRNRRKTDEGFRISHNLRTRLYNALKGKTKSAPTMELLGVPSVEFLRDYLEGTKVEGKDYSDAHIDHIRPCASFDLTDPEQQRECFHYTNLQLLPALENISKGAKIVY